MELLWAYVGAYGWARPVRVVVRAVGWKRVQVQVPLARGGTKLVTVTVDKLWPLPGPENTKVE